MARETEIEVEEKEVERVYCDECGADCTDNHQVEPKDVCTSCASDSAVSRAAKLMSPDSSGSTSWSMLLGFALIYPIIVASILMEPDHKGEDLRVTVFFIIGNTLWTAAALITAVLMVW